MPETLLSPAALLNASASMRRVTTQYDVPFGERHDLALDIYTPTETNASSPIALFVHGGGWDSGDKNIYRFLGAALASRGIVTVIPSYRVYPEVLFPAFLGDVAEAVRWAFDNLRGATRRTVLVGHSAGAHIAAMLTFDNRWLKAVGLDPNRDISGLVGLSGPYDFLPLHADRLKIIFGPEKTLASTQPINFVTLNAPPAFLAAGRFDRVVDPQNSVRLAKRINDAGGRARLQLYPWAAHANLIGAFARPLRWLAPVLQDTVEFIEGAAAGASTAPFARDVPATC